MNVKRWLLSGALCGVVAAAAGCIEEKTTITLQPTGAGTIEITQTMNKQMSAMMLMAPNLDDVAASNLADWEGIEAWSDVSATKTKDERVQIRAKGWFKDLRKVFKQGDNGPEESYEIEREGTSMTVSVVQREDEEESQPGEGDGEGDEQAEEKTPFDSSPEEIQQAKTMLSTMLDGFSMDREFVLPSKPTKVTGLKQREGNAVGVTISTKKLLEAIDKMFKEVEALRPKVEAGELDKAVASKQVEANMLKAFGDPKSGGLSASCTVAGTVTESEEFVKAFAAAKQAYGASQWKELISKERQKED